MKNISVTSLSPNSYFAAPVFLESDYIILTPEIPVSNELINRLKKWNYTYIFSDNENINYKKEVLEGAFNSNEGSLDKIVAHDEKKERFSTFYDDLVRFMDSFFNDFRQKNELNLTIITEKIKEIIEVFKTDQDYLLTFTAPRKTKVENYFIPHVVNTALISIAIGGYLKLPPHRLIDLGNAAFLHEIGMTKISSSLYMKPAELTLEEKKQIATHTLWGYKILKSFSIPETVATSALEHHERLDGSGYPRQIKGDAIQLNSRIIAVACSFDTSVSYRPFKQPLDGHAVILRLLTAQKSRFDESILKALVYTLSIFPLGTHVFLSNDSKGIVFKTSPQDPKFPIVKLTHDDKGKRIADHVLVATSKEKVYIVRALKPQEYESN
jgi:HD-GYP domain-containing protein (c-di-GMP phosphodiesterase class II)